MKLHEVRWVCVWYEADKDTTPSMQMLVAEADVQAMFSSFMKLHVDPGVNPHAGSGRPERMVRFTVSRLKTSGPHWWTTPNLGVREDTDQRPGVEYAEMNPAETEVLYEAFPMAIGRR